MRKHKKLPRPTKRTRTRLERAVHRDRLYPGRAWRLAVGNGCHVEMRVATSPRRMHELERYCDGNVGPFDRNLMGLCRYWYKRPKRCGRSLLLKPWRIVARVYLNARDLRDHPSEHVAHEMTHAAMAWARYRNADVYEVGGGEEVLAYAVGRLVKQANRILFAMGVFQR